MALSRKGLSETELQQVLFNFDESECEDCDSEDEDFEYQDPNIIFEDQDQDLDDEEGEWGDSDDEPLASIAQRNISRNRHLRWKRSEVFGGTASSSSGTSSDSTENVNVCKPYQYFFRYIGLDFFNHISECTNVSGVLRTGKSLNSTALEVKMFFGCSMAMSILGLPRVRMYWALESRVNMIAKCISRNRYFQLRANVKVVNDLTVTPAMKEIDRMWKIRPLLSLIVKACRENPRSKNISIDEQMIPFTGKCKLKQVVKGKPNPEGLKAFVSANPDGLPLDFYMYQGKGSSVESAIFPTPEKLDLGGRIILKLADTLPLNTSIFCDRYFTSIPLLEVLHDRQLQGTGTLMKPRVPQYQRPKSKKTITPLLTSDRNLQKKGRGSYDCIVRQDDKIAVVKWLDSKPIHVASTEVAIEPIGTCRRWSKVNSTYLEVPQPAAIKNYNKYMGGVDLLDRVIGKYAMRGRTGKWTVRAIFHFFDFAAAASWIEYRKDAANAGLPRKEIMQYLDFKMDLAKYLMYDGETSHINLLNSPVTRNSPRLRSSPRLPSEDLEVDLPTPPSNRKHRLVEPIPHVAKRLKEAQHLPICAKEDQKSRSKCRFKGCSQLTFIKCSSCNIFLCCNVNRNCFYNFHTMPN